MLNLVKLFGSGSPYSWWHIWERDTTIDITYNNSPILIHLRFSIWSSWAHFLNREDAWLWCLLATCCMNDLHFAATSSSNPCFVDVAHQYKWLRAPLTQSAIFSHPFSFPSFVIAFPTERATCQMSKKWAQVVWHSRIHLAIPLCLSEMKTFMDTPADWR